MKDGGDCFQVAGSIATDSLIFDQGNLTNPKLIHAVITGQGPIEGIMHDHAWVEHDVEFDTCVVRMALDRSNGKNLELPAQLFRRFAQIAPGSIREYEPEEVRRLILKYEHWGPWENEHGRSEGNGQGKRPEQKEEEEGADRDQEPHPDDARANG